MQPGTDAIREVCASTQWGRKEEVVSSALGEGVAIRRGLLEEVTRDPYKMDIFFPPRV